MGAIPTFVTAGVIGSILITDSVTNLTDPPVATTIVAAQTTGTRIDSVNITLVAQPPGASSIELITIRLWINDGTHNYLYHTSVLTKYLTGSAFPTTIFLPTMNLVLPRGYSLKVTQFNTDAALQPPLSLATYLLTATGEIYE